jgi:protein-S-isoprenylcysteine O-methyltransferase Ste14
MMAMFTPVFEIGLWNVWLFMSVFVLQMLVIMVADRRVMERSHVPKEARQNRTERLTGPIANLVWFVALGYSIFLPLRLGTIWFYVGCVVFVLGALLLAVATCNFIAATSDQLITKGAYKISRHPMYLATFLICLGGSIASVSFVFSLLSILMASCFHKEALLEERYCQKKHGRAYTEYLGKVPRWIGFPKQQIEKRE